MSPVSLKNSVIRKWLIEIPDLEYRAACRGVNVQPQLWFLSLPALSCACPWDLRSMCFSQEEQHLEATCWEKWASKKRRWLDEVSTLLQYSLVKRIAELEFKTCCEQEVSGADWMWCSILKQLVDCLKK